MPDRESYIVEALADPSRHLQENQKHAPAHQTETGGGVKTTKQ